MSGFDRRTKARLAEMADTTAVTASTSEAAVWPPIASELLADDRLDGRRLTVPAFPLDLLPQPWRDWTLDAARFSGAPVDYVVQAVLATVAAVGGRRVVVLPTPGWQEPLRLWLAAVGLPSSGKSPALEMVRHALWTLEDQGGWGRDSGDGSPRRMVLPERPFARLADTLRSDLRGMLLWRDDVVPCLAPPAGARSVRQLEPYGISIVGTARPADVERALAQDADGAARFLYAWPQAQPFRALPGLELPSSALLRPLGRLGGAFDALEGMHGLVLDNPARQAFEAFRTRLHEERRQADGIADGIEAAWLGKGGGAVARLAGVLALMSWASSEAEGLPDRVALDVVERAVSLWWDYYRPHALALFRHGGTIEESQARRVVRWLAAQRRADVSREDVRRTALGRSVDARGADDVIACLVEGGVLRLLPPPADRLGRPPVRWAVNPRLLEEEPSSLHSASRSLSRAQSRGSAPVETTEVPGANGGNAANRELH